MDCGLVARLNDLLRGKPGKFSLGFQRPAAITPRPSPPTKARHFPIGPIRGRELRHGVTADQVAGEGPRRPVVK